jgi:hypothetical protein
VSTPADQADPWADLCADPQYAQLEFCQFRLPGESPDDYHARVDDANALQVTVTKGRSWWPWVGLAALVAAIAGARKRG